MNEFPGSVSRRTLEHVAEVLLISRGSFYWRILEAVPHADPENRRRLRAGWPWLVEAYERWMASPDGQFSTDGLRELRQLSDPERERL